MIGKKFGDFEIKEEIGKGGMGNVYKAHQISLNRDVALKVLRRDLSNDDEFVKRFDIEAKFVALLIHQNIIQVYSKGTTEGIHYFAMEYVDGEDLSYKIKRGDRFSEAEAIGIIIQACQGLESAWKRNIIHRDIKPSNIMITGDGVVKIADFGLAKSLDVSQKLSMPGVYMGTVSYTSPEQGEAKKVDHRTDIYSLGIVLYELLTSKVPFTGETLSSVIYKHVHETPMSPRKVNSLLSSQIVEVVMKAIAKRPQDRFQNIIEFREALKEVKQILPNKKAKPDFPPQGKVSVWRQRRYTALATFLILLISGVVLYAFMVGSDHTSIPQQTIQPQSNNKFTEKSEVFDNKVETENELEHHIIESRNRHENTNTDSNVNRIEVDESSPGKVDNYAKEEPIILPEDSKTTYKTPALTEYKPPSHIEYNTVKRPEIPTVMVVTRGEPDVSAIVESIIERKLHESSFPVSGVEELLSVLGGYGRYEIPQHSLLNRKLNANILLYVMVDITGIRTLEYYGRLSYEYSSNITIKLIDTAKGKQVGSPIARPAKYTTLNMHDVIRETTEQMVADLPKMIEDFWNK